MPRLPRAAPLLWPACGLLAWLVAASALAQSSSDRAWGAEETVNGCQVSTRTAPGRSYVAARATCVVAADLEVIAAVLRDVERYPEWMQDCAQARLLKTVDRERDAYVFWLRQHVSMFPDRDVVLATDVPVRERDRRVIRLTSSPDATYAAVKDVVRMPSFSSEWVLERIGEGQTRVTFMIDPDLGPGLPIGIANSVIAKTPLRFVQHGLARMARRPEYVDRARSLALVQAPHAAPETTATR